METPVSIVENAGHYLTQYYGTDWLAVVFMCVYLWRVGDRKRDAFVWGALSNVFFVLLNLLIESPPGVVFNALFLLLNARAFVQWSLAGRGNESLLCPKCDNTLTGLKGRGPCPHCGNIYAIN